MTSYDQAYKSAIEKLQEGNREEAYNILDTLEYGGFMKMALGVVESQMFMRTQQETNRGILEVMDLMNKEIEALKKELREVKGK
jgi:hypothetical protein